MMGTCKALFLKKTRDYGTAWRVLRMPSITDQLFIKAQRIRNIQEKGVQLVNDSVADEFIGLVNYSIIALIQLQLQNETRVDLSAEEVEKWFDQIEKS